MPVVTTHTVTRDRKRSDHVPSTRPLDGLNRRTFLRTVGGTAALAWSNGDVDALGGEPPSYYEIDGHDHSGEAINPSSVSVTNAPADASDATRLQELNERALRTRTFDLFSGDGTEYFKIAKVSDGTIRERGEFMATIYASTDSSTSTTRKVDVTGYVRNSTYEFQTEIIGSTPAESTDLVLTETAGTGTDGDNEYYLYARADSYSQATLEFTHGPEFGVIDYQSGLASADLIGSVVEDTKTGDAQKEVGPITASDLSIDGSAAQFGVEGKVVPVGRGLGPADAVPLTNVNPINDAISTIWDTGHGGTVLLPPNYIAQETAIAMRPGISVVGWGAGDDDDSQTTIVKIQNSGEHGVEFFAPTDASITGFESCELKDFLLKGPGQTVTTGNAIQFGDPAVAEADREKVRFLNISRMIFKDWHGSLMRAEPGAAPWSLSVPHIQADRIDCSTTPHAAIFDFSASHSLAQRWGTLDIYPAIPNSDSTLQDIFRIGYAGDMYVQNPNIGGAVDRVMVNTADYGQCVFEMVNYEPGLMTGITRQMIFDIQGDQYVRVNSVINRAQDSTTVNYCYILGVNSPMKDKYLAAPQTAYQRSFAHAELRTKVDVGENVVFEGMSANCMNTSGATLSGEIACQGDLTMFTG